MLDKMEERLPSDKNRDPVIFSCAGMELESVSTKLVDTVRSATMLGGKLNVNRPSAPAATAASGR